MSFHTGLDELGEIVQPSALKLARSVALATYLASGDNADARLLQCRQRRDDGRETVVFEVHSERPQDLRANVRRWEPIAAVFTPKDNRHPLTFSARQDFPETPHQNAVPLSHMRCPCIDDRPWAEANASWTPLSFVERMRWWLGAAAIGALSDDVQAMDPLFVSSGPDIAIARSFLQPDAPAQDVALFLGAGGDRTKLYLLSAERSRASHQGAALRVVPIRLEPQLMRAIRSAPRNLADLVSQLSESGCNLVQVLRDAAKTVLQPPHADAVMVAVLVVAPIVRKEGGPVTAEDAKAFGIHLSLADLGERLGVLQRYPKDAPEAAKAFPFGLALRPSTPERLDQIEVDSMPLHVTFDRELARQCAGLDSVDERKVVLVGAGAVGSHLALAMAREGRFHWTILDDDHLLPHNLARHALGRRSLGAFKAEALAAEVADLFDDLSVASGVAVNVLGESGDGPGLEARLAHADLVIDASASVAVGRALADAAGRAPRMSVFLNPTGTASVLLAEDSARRVRLDEVEGQYYRLLLRDPSLRGHLSLPPSGVRFTGACRSLSSRIPETSVMALTGIAARGMAAAADAGRGCISIWSMDEDGQVVLAKSPVSQTQRSQIGDWVVVHDDALLKRMHLMRRAALPRETGGVLVGIVDVARRVIVVVDALDPPSDSIGSPSGFERGVDGLIDRLREVQDITRDQVRYIGEWHSHPRGHDTRPSRVDAVQMMTLSAELGREGIPPVMMIVGEGTKAAVVSTVTLEKRHHRPIGFPDAEHGP